MHNNYPKPPKMTKAEMLYHNAWVESRPNQYLASIVREFPMFKKFTQEQGISWTEIESGKVDINVIPRGTEFPMNRSWMTFQPNSVTLIAPLMPINRFRDTCSECQAPHTAPFLKRGTFVLNKRADRFQFSFSEEKGFEIWIADEPFENQIANLGLRRAAIGIRHVNVMSDYSIKRVALLPDAFLEKKMIEEMSYIDHLGIVRDLHDLEIGLKKFNLTDEEKEQYDKAPQCIMFYQILENAQRDVNWEDTIFVAKVTTKNVDWFCETLEAAKRAKISSAKFKRFAHLGELNRVTEEIHSTTYLKEESSQKQTILEKIRQKHKERKERKERELATKPILTPQQSPSPPPVPEVDVRFENNKLVVQMEASPPVPHVESFDDSFNREGANKSAPLPTLSHSQRLAKVSG